MRSKRKASFALIALLACLMPAAAQQASDARVADLAQSGKLRVGLFPPQYVKDTTTGRPKSAWVEIARALAAHIGVEPALVEHPTPITSKPANVT